MENETIDSNLDFVELYFSTDVTKSISNSSILQIL